MDTMKPKLKANELVDKMRSNGITFDIITQDQAESYLSEHSNYYRLASYRKNYDKFLHGSQMGKYMSLDFAYLAELSTIDMHLRYLVIKMCLDIEHSLKVKLLSDISSNINEDGYSIVERFLTNNNWLYDDIYKKCSSPYVGDLINKFFTFDTHRSNSGSTIFDNISSICPVWAFVEIISFGAFIKFFDFYYTTYPCPKVSIGVLNSVKSLRNACAHNNCVINNLRKGSTRPCAEISQFISNIDTITKSERKSKLKIRPMYEFISLIYLYHSVVFEPVKAHRIDELKELVNNRMVKHKEYFVNQQIIRSSYSFLKKVVDFLQ